MTSFLSHAQQADLRRRVLRTLSEGKRGTTFGDKRSTLNPDESRTLEAVLDAMDDMHREGSL